MVIECEERIKIALNSLKRKEFNTIYSTAMHFKVSQITLGRHWKKEKSMIKAHESQQLLSSAEEKVLTERIYQIIIINHPPTKNLIYEIAEELRQHRLIDINDDRIQQVNNESIGHEWIL
jgi:hypothetical protein